MSVRENIYANFLILIVQNAKARKVENGGLSSEDDNQGPNAPEVDADVILMTILILIGLVSVLFLIIKIAPAFKRDNSNQWNKEEVSMRMLGSETKADR